MRQFQSEQFRTLLRLEENPKGKTKALAVKGERHPTCSLDSNPGRNGERQTCHHGATKFDNYKNMGMCFSYV